MARANRLEHGGAAASARMELLRQMRMVEDGTPAEISPAERERARKRKAAEKAGRRAAKKGRRR